MQVGSQKKFGFDPFFLSLPLASTTALAGKMSAASNPKINYRP